VVIASSSRSTTARWCRVRLPGVKGEHLGLDLAARVWGIRQDGRSAALWRQADRNGVSQVTDRRLTGPAC